MTKETKVGMIALLLCLVIGLLWFFAHPFQEKDNDSIQVKALFDSAQGLHVGGHVMYAGVSVGKIKHISIENGKAVITLAISPGAHIPQDAQFTIDSNGLLEDSHVRISGGDISKGELATGTTVEEFHSHKRDQLMEKADHLMKTAEDVGKNVNHMTDSFSKS